MIPIEIYQQLHKAITNYGLSYGKKILDDNPTWKVIALYIDDLETVTVISKSDKQQIRDLLTNVVIGDLPNEYKVNRTNTKVQRRKVHRVVTTNEVIS